MFSKIFKVLVITGTVFSLSLIIVFTASYFHFLDAVDKKLCDEMLVDFAYYAERGLYIWTVFNFIEIIGINVFLVTKQLNLSQKSKSPILKKEKNYPILYKT